MEHYQNKIQLRIVHKVKMVIKIQLMKSRKHLIRFQTTKKSISIKKRSV